MANASVESLQFLRAVPPMATATPDRRATQGIAHPAERSTALWDLEHIPDQSYWTAYDHFMVEREARTARRAYVWALVAKAWSALRFRHTS